MAQGTKIPSVARYWPGGCDSFTLPDQLRPIDYVFAQNVVNRGGLPQTRPGMRTMYCLPRGKPQGFAIFTPASGIAHHVAAVGGSIYVAPYPFREWRQLPGLQFNPNSKWVVMKPALKSTDYSPSGELFFLEQPYKVLVFQDMSARSGFWDGSESRHLNPTPSLGEVTTLGYDETPIGLHMVFSNGRLWVAFKNMVFASDVGNPLKFTEAQYLNEAPAFYLPDDCTGMIETPDQGGILCGHSLGVDYIETSIIDRTQWLSTPNMIRTIVPIGCVAPRSMINRNNLIYWFSPLGLISLNQALSTYQNSSLIPLDQEMAWSKSFLAPDLSVIAAGGFENYLLLSVPFGGLENRHTWAMDLATFENQERSWNGSWTGVRPVEWATETIHNHARAFFLSADSDGENRVWEAFMPDRTDNGCAITCSIQFRSENFGTETLKKWLMAEIELAQVYGHVSMMAAVAGSRGWFDKVMNKEMVASEGRIDSELEYDESFLMGGNRPQVRTIRTQEWPKPTDCNTCGVESMRPNNIDHAFDFFLAWSGRAGVHALRQVALTEAESHDGACEKDESEFNTLTQEGCASKEQNPDVDPFPTFTGVGNAQGPGLENDAQQIIVETCARSQISQADADRKAQCFADRQYALLASLPFLPAMEFTAGCTTIRVTGPSDMRLFSEDGLTELTDLDFGDVICGTSMTAERTLRISNLGSGPGSIESLLLDLGEHFEIVSVPEDLEVPPGGYVLITVRVTAPPCD